MNRVLVLANGPIKAAMDGPAIRSWELAHILAAQQEVTLGTPNARPPESLTLEVCCYRNGRLPRLLNEHDVVVACGYPLRHHPIIERRAKHLVVDMYDPYLVEILHLNHGFDVRQQARMHEYFIDSVLEHLQAGDFFICAGERQRDYWLGGLSLANRVNPHTHQSDPTLRRLIDIVPFGLPLEPPSPASHAIKGVVSGIDRDDLVVLWGGGIWDWLDPLTAIRAMSGLTDRLPNLKLYLMGARHPDPGAPKMEMPVRARRLAEQLGLLGRTVFFEERWVPYRERVNYLCDADIGLTLHQDHIETRLAYRTRVLDYLWASLPIVSTRGDELCESVVDAGAGVAVDGGDVEGVRVALSTLAESSGRRAVMSQRAREVAKKHAWGRVAAPLLNYCTDPWRAPDRGDSTMLRPRMDRRRLLLRRIMHIARHQGRREAARLALGWLSGVGELASTVGLRRGR